MEDRIRLRAFQWLKEQEAIYGDILPVSKQQCRIASVCRSDLTASSMLSRLFLDQAGSLASGLGNRLEQRGGDLHGCTLHFK